MKQGSEECSAWGIASQRRLSGSQEPGPGGSELQVGGKEVNRLSHWSE